MFESIGRSWEIAKLSFNVVKSDKEMLLFPLLAGIFSLLFIVAMVFPTIITGFLISGLDESVVDLAIYAILFLVYLGLAAIATFFNVCVVYTTKKRFEGGDSKFFEAIGFAFSRLPVIIAWAIVSATVGIILNILSSQAEKMGAVGQIVMKIFVSLLGAAWGILTIFVVPSLVYENVGPFEAIKKSASVLKKTWGESLTRHFALGMAQFICLFVGLVIGSVLIIGSTMIHPALMLVMIGVLILYILGVILLFNVLNSVFNTALYVYAEKGIVPSMFTQETLQNAFQTKQKKGLL
jgi:hypothetical protein